MEQIKLYENVRTGKDAGSMQFRVPESIAEMVCHCSANGHIWVRSARGDARRVKVNGSVRTWKRDANRIEVPCKYGLYEYFVLQARDINDVLIPCASQVSGKHSRSLTPLTSHSIGETCE